MADQPPPTLPAPPPEPFGAARGRIGNAEPSGRVPGGFGLVGPRWALVPRGAPQGARGGKISPRGIWLGGQTKENCHLMRGSVDSGYRPTSVLGSHLLSSGKLGPRGDL